jgi:hypothetical protein
MEPVSSWNMATPERGFLAWLTTEAYKKLEWSPFGGHGLGSFVSFTG